MAAKSARILTAGHAATKGQVELLSGAAVILISHPKLVSRRHLRESVITFRSQPRLSTIGKLFYRGV